jgi:excisionase family DNA binding protein
MIEATQGDLTSAETKRELNCSNKTFWKLVREQELDAYYVGRTIRIVRESVARLKERKRYVPRTKIAARARPQSR